jgi:acetamidase/formamidase
MQRATRDVLYFETGPDNPVTLRVQPGEEFEVETQLNRGPWLDTDPDGPRLRQLLRGGNPASGCIHVEGAEPGMVLNVHVGAIELDPVGFTNFRGANGAMPAWFGSSGVGPQSRVVRIETQEIIWSERRRLQARPMIGFIGVAPQFEKIANVWGGFWGGNFDVQEITTGATVQLRVNVPGAKLHVGDMHAIQGDGEICGAGGIEAGGRVRMKCTLAPAPVNFTWPRIENATHIMTAAMARPCEDAFRHALEALVLWLEADYGFSRGEAYTYLGQVLEARCTQFVNPTFTYVAKVRRDLIA